MSAASSQRRNKLARNIENPAVVPRTFGPFGGQLWVSDEDYPNTVSTVPGALHAMDSGGNVTLDVVEWQGAEGVLVIPHNPCTFCYERHPLSGDHTQ